MTKLDVIEWAQADKYGDREYFGEHMYSEEECLRVVKRGGLLVFRHMDAETEARVIRAFETA